MLKIFKYTVNILKLYFYKQENIKIKMKEQKVKRSLLGNTYVLLNKLSRQCKTREHKI